MEGRRIGQRESGGFTASTELVSSGRRRSAVLPIMTPCRAATANRSQDEQTARRNALSETGVRSLATSTIKGLSYGSGEAWG